MNPDLSSPATQEAWREQRHHRRHLGTGIFLILLGLLLAFSQWGHAPFHDLGRHWPLILIALAAGRFVDRGFFHSGAHWLLLVGLYFELERNGQADLVHHFWPLGLVWIGLIMTLRALSPRPRLNP